jgi:hypothetical protein
MEDFAISIARMAMRLEGSNYRKAARLLGISVSTLGRIEARATRRRDNDGRI